MFGTETNPWFDRPVLVTSATEGAGPDLVRALVAEGARPVVVGGETGALRRLSRDLGGISTLAADPFAPDAILGIARWLAEHHPDLGGLLCIPPPSAGRGAIVSPLAAFGLAGSLVPARQDLLVGLVLPDLPEMRGLARLAVRLRELRWNIGARSGLSAILLGPGFAMSDAAFRARAARRVLGAVASGRAALRITPPRGPAGLQAGGAPCVPRGA